MSTVRSTVRIGACAMIVSKEEKHQPVFYDKLFALCDRILPGCGCDIVLLPERWGFRPDERQPLTGSLARRFGALAKKHELYLLAPLAEVDRGRVFNTQAVFTPGGQIAFCYRKVQLAPGEEADTAPGDRFETFDLPWFRAGIVICYDNQFPETTRCLAVQGAQVVFYPSYGNERKPRRTAARSLDSGIYQVGAGIIDRDCGLPDEALEGSLIMMPDATVLAERHDEEPVIADLMLDPVTGRLPLSEQHGTYLHRRRPECFTSLCAR